MAGYAKVFSSIVTSSLWCMEHAVLRIWIAMLTTCNSEGVVEGSVPGFASLCRVTIEEMEKAVKVLSSPDPHSRTQDFEGRRIEVIPGGWKILNYKSYRDKGQEKEGSKAPFMRLSRQRAKARLEAEGNGNALPEDATSYPTANANAGTEVPPKPPRGGKGRRTRQEILQPFSEGTRRVVNTLGVEWHKEDPKDGRKITISPEGFAEAVDRVKAEQPHLDDDLIIDAGRNYLAEKRERYKAPQWFFGVEGPWGGYVRAILTRREREAGKPQQLKAVG